MSFRLYPLAWAAALPTKEKIVLLKLVDHAADDGTNVRPSVATIARACGLTSRSVTSALGSLRSAGILVMVREADPGTKRPREYHLDLGRLKSLNGAREGGTYFTPETASPMNDVPRPLKEIPGTPEIVSPKSINEPIKEPSIAAEAAPAPAGTTDAIEKGGQFDLQVQAPGATLLSGVRVDAPPVDRKKALYDFGRIVLGANSGGQITNLIKHHDNDLEAVDRTLRLASVKSNAREYVGAILRVNADTRHTDVVSRVDEDYRRWGVQ